MRSGGQAEHESPLEQPSASENSSASIDYVQLAIRFKWLLIIGATIGLVVGQMGYVKLGPMYEAYSQILVSKKESVLNQQMEAKVRSGDRAEHLALILSPMIIDRAIAAEKLDQLQSLDGYDDPTEAILANLTVKRSAGQDRSTINVVDVKYKSKSPTDARLVVQAVIDAYRSYLMESHQESTNKLLQLIGDASQDISRQLREKQQEYQQFRLEAPFMWSNGGAGGAGTATTTNAHQERVLVIEKERHQLMLKQAELNSRKRSLRQALQADASAELLDMMVARFLSADNATLADQAVLQAQANHDDRLLPLLLQKIQLERDYAADHPLVVEIDKQIAEIRKFYQLRGARTENQAKLPDPKSRSRNRAIDYLALIDHELGEIAERDEHLQAQFDEHSTAAKELATFHARDQVFKEEIGHLKELRKTVENRAQTSALEKDNTGYEMKQIAPVRDALDFKRHLKFLLGGLIAGLVAAGGLAVWKELKDTTLKSIEELRRRVHLPILGAIPTSLPRVVRDARIDRSLCYFHFPDSVAAESYRSVRTALSTYSPPLKVVAITSSEPGDGKSTFISNLAVALTQVGKKVLLIDADLRRPRLHELFTLRSDVGLSDVLAGEIELTNAVQESVVANLSILVAGVPPSNPSELLSRPTLKSALELAQVNYDVVLVDTPPVLAVSDVCSIGQYTSGVLMVVRLNKTSRLSAVRAHELLEAHNIAIHGAVANGYEQNSVESKSYGYGQSYSKKTPSEPPVEVETVPATVS